LKWGGIFPGERYCLVSSPGKVAKLGGRDGVQLSLCLIGDPSRELRATNRMQGASQTVRCLLDKDVRLLQISVIDQIRRPDGGDNLRKCLAGNLAPPSLAVGSRLSAELAGCVYDRHATLTGT
jgi:hypothetical protein